MDAATFHLSLTHLAGQGVVLSTEHSVAMQSSLLLLKNSQQFARLSFWGKIKGSGVADYYIAQGFGAEAMATPTTFYSQDCVNWAMLQTVHPVLAATCARIRTRFTGNPSTEVQVVEPGPSPEQAKPDVPAEVAAMRSESTREDGSTVVSTTVTEDKRLAAVVAAIDAEVGIVPRGRYKITAADEVQVNGSFCGLSLPEALRVDSYCHFRKSTNKAKLADSPNRALDFLDGIADDVPSQSWSIKSQRGGGVVVISSLAWPGSVAYTIPETPQFGQVYFGTGVKNTDLAFML